MNIYMQHFMQNKPFNFPTTEEQDTNVITWILIL